jgi:BirA family biotin operon repressor/biotin-[acetyl-CoA-carboxylase] ligase
MRPIILKYDSLPSTNTEAANQARLGAAEGLCIVAREQTAGRGRQQRTWVSPSGAGLYLSIVLRPKLVSHQWPLITLMTSLAVADTLEQVCGLRSDIKWPNDVLIDGRKICGILAETVETEAGRAAIVGIGINLNSNSLPDELRDIATSVEDASGQTVDEEVLFSKLLDLFAVRYDALHEFEGTNKLLREWTARSSYAEGKRVRVSIGDGIVDGTTRGIASDGALRVETATGEITLVHAGDVTLSGAPTEGRPYSG